MRSWTPTFALLYLAAAPALAPAAALAPPQIIKGPYLQNMTRQSVTIMWETDTPADSTVHYFADGQWLDAPDPTPVTIHEVHLDGFSASEMITYSVESANGQGHAQSTQAIFKMAPPTGTPFRMCVWGDNQDRPEVFSQHVAKMIVDQPDMLLACGDVVSTGSDYAQWDNRFLGPLRPLIQYTPMIVAIGNHEGNSHWFYDFLDQPGNEHWFSYTYGNAFFLVLDTNFPFERGTEQYAFAESALLSDEAQNATWLFVAHHHPPYSEVYEESTYARIREHLIPLYESAGVDVVFHGHIHDYERGEFVPVKTDRRIWEVQTSGAGGTLWSDEFDGDWEQIDLVITDVFHYCTVDVGADQLHLQAIDLAGNVIDQFTIDAAPREGTLPDDDGSGDPGPTQWDFASGDLAASYGPGEIEFADGPGGPTGQQTAFGSTSALGLPPIGAQAAHVMAFPKAASSTMGFRVRHGAPANGGGAYVNDYTLILDMLLPQSSINADDWLPIHNTNATNTNDADSWVRLADGAVGVSGQYDGAIPADTWRRVALVFDYDGSTERLHKYIDGAPVGTQDLGGLDGRWSLYTRADATPWFYLFTDDNGEAASAVVSSIHFTDRAMSDAEIAALGPADADGILPDPAACTADWNHDGVVNTQDFVAFLNEWAAHDRPADLNGDGFVDTRDFIAFLNLWSAGCP
ncbi:MAG: metallophosphoesterase [Phycisphaerales bacterium]|nr:metallophosphoesterase [Phycisphaerales bacterium]